MKRPAQPDCSPATQRGIRGLVVWLATRPGAGWLVLTLGLLVTLSASLAAWEQRKSRDRMRFEAQTEALEHSIAERLDRCLELLRGAGGLFAASWKVEQDEWRRYTEGVGLRRHFPSVRALGCAERIPAADLRFQIERRRQEGPDGDGAGAFEVWPPGARDPYYVVTMVEPIERNHQALGYDLASDAARREAADRAGDTGEPTLTPRLQLVQAPDSVGALLLLPVYEHGYPLTDIASRRAALRGWVYAAIVLDEILADIHQPLGEELSFELFDGPVTSPDTRLAALDQGIKPNTAPPKGRFEREMRLAFCNRIWTLRCRSSKPAGLAHWFAAPGPIGAAGLGFCISALAFMVFRTMSATQAKAQNLARSMTAELRLLNRAVESANDGVFILDAARPDWPILYSNPAFLRMKGCSRADQLSKDTLSIIRGKPNETALSSVRSDLKSGLHSQAVVRESRADGTTLWAAYSVAPLRNEAGEITHYVGITEDVTERRQAELALRESQERLDLVIRGSNDGIWDWNVRTDEVYFSERWKSMLGFEEQEIENNFAAWEDLLHPEDRERSLRAIQDYFEGKTSAYELEHRLRHKDGTYRWILARGVALRDAQGKPVRMAGSHLDLTQRKEAEAALSRTCRDLAQSQAALEMKVHELNVSHQELERTQAQLIQAAKLECIGTLAAGVAHEVKNPLQSMLVGLDYLRNHLGPHADEPTTVALADMRDAVKRADSIVRELLHFSSNTPFQAELMDLNLLVERSLWLIQPQVCASRSEIVRKLQPALPPVRADKGKMEQVFINVFLNALQAMGERGTLTIQSHAAVVGNGVPFDQQAHPRFKAGDPVVVVAVRDSGPGIPAEHLPRVFDPFFTTKPVGVGTGLGLAVVKRILDLHAGSIQVSNAPEGGAQVTLVLPACDKDIP